jgi:hypothetical protein
MKIQATAHRAIQARVLDNKPSKIQSGAAITDLAIPAQPESAPMTGRLLVRLVTGAALPSAVVLAARAVWGEAAATPALIATTGVGALLSGASTLRMCHQQRDGVGFTIAATASSACLGGLASFGLGVMAMPSQGQCAMLPFRPELFGQMATAAAVAAPAVLATAAFFPSLTDSK